MRTFGIPKIAAAATTITTTAMRRTSTIESVGIFPVLMLVGDSATAKKSRITWATMLPTLMSRPPDATADARSTPWRWRKRICAAMPPTAGTARFENDIESCSSAVRMSGSPIGTVPMSATAVQKLVRSERNIATASHHQFAPLMVSQNVAGSPTCDSSAKTAISVPIAISRLVPLTR